MYIYIYTQLYTHLVYTKYDVSHMSSHARPPPEEAVDRLIHRSDDQDRRSWKAGEILTGG